MNEYQHYGRGWHDNNPSTLDRRVARIRDRQAAQARQAERDARRARTPEQVAADVIEQRLRFAEEARRDAH